MRFPTLLAFAILAATSRLVAAAPATQTAPKPPRPTPPRPGVFTSRAEGFSVWLPDHPRENRHVKVSKTGQQAVTTLFNAQVGFVSYIVSIAPHAFPATAAGQTVALNELQRDIIKSSQATLQKSADIQQNGFRGRALQLSVGKGKALFRGRIFLTPRGTYSLCALGYVAPMKKQSATINHAFASFRILPN